MAASLTVSGAVVASSGLTVDLTIAGGTGTIQPATGITGFTIKKGGVAAEATSVVKQSSTVVRVTLPMAIRTGETITFAYAPGNLTDSADPVNTLPAIASQAVTNNSTADYPDAVEGIAGDLSVAVVLTWDEHEDAATYNVYRDGVLLTNTEELTYTDTVRYGSKHTYKVTAKTAGLLESQTGDSLSTRASLDAARTFATAEVSGVLYIDANGNTRDAENNVVEAA